MSNDIKVELSYQEVQLILEFGWIFNDQLKARLKRIKPNKTGIHRVKIDSYSLNGIIGDLTHHEKDPSNHHLSHAFDELISVLESASDR